METGLQFLVVVMLLLILPAVATRNALVPALVLSSFFTIMVPLNFGLNTGSLLAASLFLALFILSILWSMKKGIFRLEQQADLKVWRILARPFALLFIPVNILAGHRFLLYLLGVLCLIFISAGL